MGEKRVDVFAAFIRQFWRSPVRWVVLLHALLLGSLIALMTLKPGLDVLWQVDFSLVLAQVSLVLIWMALSDGQPMSRDRMVGATCVLLAIYLAHTPAVGDPEWMFTAVCVGPCIFLLIGVAALPLSVAASKGLLIARFRPEAMPPSRKLQISIRGLLWISAGIAVLFGLGEFSLTTGRQTGESGAGIGEALATLVVILVISTIYLSVPLVATWAILSPGKILPRLVVSVIAWAMGGMLMFHYTRIGEGLPQLGTADSVTAGVILILLSTLLVLRRMGYRAVQTDRDGRILPANPEPNPGAKDSSHHAPP